jgi:hypothetical protein
MPKVNLPVRVEPGLYDRLKQQAGEKSLSAHVEGLLETMLASAAGADLREETCEVALHDLEQKLAAARRQISQISSERDTLRAALGQAQQQVTSLDGERNRLTSYLENARSTPTITYRQPSPTAQQLAEERRSHLDQLVKARAQFFGRGMALALPLWLLLLLLVPHDTLLARGVAHLAVAPFADVRVAAVRLMGKDVAFAWLLHDCPIVLESVRRHEAEAAAKTRSAKAARSTEGSRRTKAADSGKRKPDRQPGSRPHAPAPHGPARGPAAGGR